MGAHSVDNWAEKQRGLSSNISVEKNLGGVLVEEGGARRETEHCRGTLEQSIKPPNVPIGPCLELVTHSRDVTVNKKAGFRVPPPPR